jgi:pimeloyl-ACP methyl ester carboxylesterase
VLPRPRPESEGKAQSVDGTNIAWYRYGQGDRTILFVPTWNIVDARVVGHQVAELASHATVLTLDPRGAGESDRPERGYDFPLHAADVLAVLDANGIHGASLVTASRGVNTAILLIAEDPARFDRLAAIAPYVELETNADPPDPEVLEEWRTDWPGFIVPFMQSVFSEPHSTDVIAEVTAIGLEATPDVIVTQVVESDWQEPARRLRSVTCPTLVIHGDSDEAIPVEDVQRIVDAIPNARLELIPGGGHRPDIRSPEIVNPLLSAFLVD